MIKSIEAKLRECVKKYGDSLINQTADLARSQEVVLETIAERIKELDRKGAADVPEPEPQIKLVSIDVQQTQAHNIVKQLLQDSDCSFLVDSAPETEGGIYTDSRFVTKTHVTMEFWNRSTQNGMREKFDEIIGSEVILEAKAFLWDEKAAAIEVSIAAATTDGKIVAPCSNKFSHITVWVAEGARAAMSNDLPEKVSHGEANRIEIPSAVSLIGKLSYWDFENKVLPKESSN